MNLEAVLDLGQEEEWDFSIDVDRIPLEVLNQSGPTIPKTLTIPDDQPPTITSKALLNYKSMATYLLLSAAVHGVILKEVDSPVHFQRLDAFQEQQQEVLEHYLDHHVPLAILAQINPEKEAEPLPKDITEIISCLVEKYETQKKLFVESTAKDLADGKLDDISLAEFVLTLQVLRYNIHTLQTDDYPLEKVYDVQTVIDDFGKKVRGAKEITGTSCDLD